MVVTVPSAPTRCCSGSSFRTGFAATAMSSQRSWPVPRVWGVASLDARHNRLTRTCAETGSPSLLPSECVGGRMGGQGWPCRSGPAPGGRREDAPRPVTQGVVSTQNKGNLFSNIPEVYSLELPAVTILSTESVTPRADSVCVWEGKVVQAGPGAGLCVF